MAMEYPPSVDAADQASELQSVRITKKPPSKACVRHMSGLSIQMNPVNERHLDLDSRSTLTQNFTLTLVIVPKFTRSEYTRSSTSGLSGISAAVVLLGEGSSAQTMGPVGNHGLGPGELSGFGKNLASWVCESRFNSWFVFYDVRQVSCAMSVFQDGKGHCNERLTKRLGHK